MWLDIDDIPLYLINLPDRPERLRRSVAELHGFFGTDKHINVIEAVRSIPGMYGARASHQMAVRKAMDASHERIIVAEDDVRFQSDQSRDYAVRCFQNAPDDFGMLLGGVYSGRPTQHSEHWDEITNFSALHFYCLDRRSYHRVLALTGDLPIDMQLGLSADVRKYVARSFFAIQHHGEVSDTVGKTVDYTDCLKQFRVLKDI